MPPTLTLLAVVVTLTIGGAKILGTTFNIVTVLRDTVKLSTAAMAQLVVLETRVARIEGHVGLAVAE